MARRGTTSGANATGRKSARLDLRLVFPETVQLRCCARTRPPTQPDSPNHVGIGKRLRRCHVARHEKSSEFCDCLSLSVAVHVGQLQVLLWRRSLPWPKIWLVVKSLKQELAPPAIGGPSGRGRTFAVHVLTTVQAVNGCLWKRRSELTVGED